MESKPFLTVDQQPITLKEALQYLQSLGKLETFIGDILRQYAIETEIKSRDDVVVDPATIEQAVIDFRVQNQLLDAKRFQQWLVNNGMDFKAFHNRVATNFQQEKLKALVTEPKLQEYFIERKLFLDRAVISRIIVDNKELAEELHSQIKEEEATFEELAREYSLTDDRIANGMMGPVSKGTMPDELRAAVDAASPGNLIGPLQVEERWGIFRVEQFIEASFENEQLKKILQNELFEQWLTEKIQKMEIQVQAD